MSKVLKHKMIKNNLSDMKFAKSFQLPCFGPQFFAL